MAYALDALRRRPGRTAATAVGIGLATALVVVLLAISNGVQASTERLAVASGIDLLATSANTSLASGAFPPIDRAHALPAALTDADPNVATASPWLLSSMVFANGSLAAAVNRSQVPPGWGPTSASSVGWIPDRNTGIEVPTVSEGTGFSAPGDPHYANGTFRGPETHAVVLDQGAALVLGVHPGDSLYVSPQAASGPAALRGWFANATEFHVVGVSGPFWLIPSALIGFFYLSELQQLLGNASIANDRATIVLLHLHDGSNPSHDQAILSNAFRSLTIFTVGNLLGAVDDALELYRTFGSLIGLIGIAVATMFTTTVLLMSVDDRSREIALLRALGYSPRAIGGFVVQEGVLLSLLGLGIGLVGGAVGAYGMNVFLERSVRGLPTGFSFIAFDASVVGQGLLEVLAIGLFASVLPAVRALQLPVVEELRAP